MRKSTVTSQVTDKEENKKQSEMEKMRIRQQPSELLKMKNIDDFANDQGQIQ